MTKKKNIQLKERNQQIGAQGNKRKYQSSRGWGGGEVEKGEEREE